MSEAPAVPPERGAPAEVPASTGNPRVDAILADRGDPMAAAANEPIGGIGISRPTSPYDRFTGQSSEAGMTALYALPHEMREAGLSKSYVAGDQQTIWQGLPFEDRVRLQDRLVSYGLAPSVIPGELDEGTLNGINRLLSMSNRSGTNWRATLGRLDGLQEQGLLESQQEEQPEFREPVYLKPDYATLSQHVKDTVRDKLGRDPDQGEMEELVSFLGGMSRQQYERDVELARMEWEHEQGLSPEGGAAVEPTVDPFARFQEQFEKVYKPERRFLRDKESAVESRQQIEQSTGLLSAMSQQEGRR